MMNINSKSLTKRYVLPFIQKIVQESFKEHFDDLVIKYSNVTCSDEKLNIILKEIEIVCLVSCQCSITREFSEVTIFDLDKRGNPFYKVLRDLFKDFKENFVFMDPLQECIENELVKRKQILEEIGLTTKKQNIN